MTVPEVTVTVNSTQASSLTQSITLERFALNNYTPDDTLELTFQPGNHSLGVELNVSSTKRFIMQGLSSEDYNVTHSLIVCNEQGNFILVEIVSVEIRKLTFIDCGLRIVNVCDVIVSDCIFLVYQTGSLLTLTAIASYANITDVKFNNSISTFGLLPFQSVSSNTDCTHSNLTREHTVCYSNYELKRSSIAAFIQSTVNFNGMTTFHNNILGGNGGAIYGENSTLRIHGKLQINHNIAKKGGGIYLNGSELTVCNGTCTFTRNTAHDSGGAMYVFDSTVRLNGTGVMIISHNKANQGGGISFEGNSQFDLIPNASCEYRANSSGFFNISFVENVARMNGGGIFLRPDDTNLASCSTWLIYETLNNKPFLFINNFAMSGSVLYIDLSRDSDGNSCCYDDNLISDCSSLFGVIQSLTQTELNEGEIASNAVDICFCQNMEPNCSLPTLNKDIKNGKPLTVEVLTVDIFNHGVNATVYTSIANNTKMKKEDKFKYKFTLGEGQKFQSTSTECTNLTFTVYSRVAPIHKNIYLDMQLCKKYDALCTKHHKRINIGFPNCNCPTGLEVNQRDIRNCPCISSPKLQRYIEVFKENGTFYFSRITNCWIGCDNKTDPIVYPTCPYDYCNTPLLTNKKYERINLNIPNGRDAQCANNRSGLLCGRCKKGLTISVSTSQCLKCSAHWKIILSFVTLYILFIGIATGLLVLWLNLTVQSGMINGLIFYANIVFVNQQTYLPSTDKRALSVFINYLNLNFLSGINTCIHKDMNEYVKTWLLIALPLYTVTTSGIIITIMKLSSKCSLFMNKRNPINVLATLALLCYTNLLHTSIRVFSYANIVNFDKGYHKIVWRPDPSVDFFLGKHFPLAICAFIIFTVGLGYAVLLFFWQWIVRSQKKCILKWTRNETCQALMEAYLTPYRPEYHYWTGLLLFIRIIIIIIAAIPDGGHHSLLAIVIVIAILFLIKAYLGKRLYKKRLLDYFETTSYFNLLLFSVALFPFQNNPRGHKAAASISFAIALVMFIIVISYHIHLNLHKIWWYQRLQEFLEQRIINRIKARLMKKERILSRTYSLNIKLESDTSATTTEVGLDDEVQRSKNYVTPQSGLGDDQPKQNKNKQTTHYNILQSDKSYNSYRLRESLLQEHYGDFNVL